MSDRPAALAELPPAPPLPGVGALLAWYGAVMTYALAIFSVLIYWSTPTVRGGAYWSGDAGVLTVMVGPAAGTLFYLGAHAWERAATGRLASGWVR